MFADGRRSRGAAGERVVQRYALPLIITEFTKKIASFLLSPVRFWRLRGARVPPILLARPSRSRSRPPCRPRSRRRRRCYHRRDGCGASKCRRRRRRSLARPACALLRSWWRVHRRVFPVRLRRRVTGCGRRRNCRRCRRLCLWRWPRTIRRRRPRISCPRRIIWSSGIPCSEHRAVCDRGVHCEVDGLRFL